MDVQSLSIPEVKLITPRRFPDDRGWFSETYNSRALAEAGIDLDFVQDNHSYSAKRGTVRGLHYQGPPAPQDKLVRVAVGRVLDVAVDARAGSPTYGQYAAAELSAENGAQLLCPAGFLHGFMTLEDDCHVLYKVTHFYNRDSEGGVTFDDPDLGIEWPIPASEAVLSDKDKVAPRFADFVSPFRYPD